MFPESVVPMKENPPAWYESLRKPEIAWFAIAAVWALWMLEPFYFTGMTTSDQLGFSLVNEGEYFSSALDAAKSQGRIYFLLTKPIDFFMASNPVSRFLNGLNLFVFVFSPIAFALSVFRDVFSRYLFFFLFVCLSWVGYYHMPPSAYPVVNHFVFPVWAFIAVMVRKWESKAISKASLGLFFCLTFFALFQYEPVASMTLLVVLWSIYASELERKGKRQLYILFFAAVIFYGLTYIIWARMYPSEYDGLEAGAFSVSSIFKTIISYTLGGLPFLTSNANEIYLELTSEFGWGGAVSHNLFEGYGLSVRTLLLVFSAAFAVFVILGNRLRDDSNKSNAMDESMSTGRSKLPALWILVVFGIALAFAPNVLLGFSSKYQSWADTWSEAYLTSQLSLYGWCVILVCFVRWLALKTNGRGVSIGLAFAVLVFALVAIPNRERNDSLARIQRTLLARWEVVAVLDSAKEHWETDVLLAPQLRLTSFAARSDWGAYWQLYSKIRYKCDVKFEHSLDGGLDDSKRCVGIKYFTDDEGYVTTVLVQSGSMLHVVALMDAPPRAIVSNTTGKGIPFNWGAESRDLDYGDYRILSLDLGVLEDGVVDPLKPSSNVDIWF